MYALFTCKGSPENRLLERGIFSVTRRSISDESHSLSHSLDVLIDLTDVTLVSDDTYRRLY